ncbi:glycosyltransferase family 39 protein [Breoghania sp. L-A4]|nr:glycosyltransferase family 39 protein [Breoghania sp. L-A4]
MTPPPRWLRAASAPGVAPLLLTLLALAMFLPGFWLVPPLDRDEPRFAQASKQMLETGDYVDIRYQEATRHKKPVGIYWLQVAAAKITGFEADAPIWVYRLPSLIGAVLAVLLTFWTARAFTGPPVAFIAAAFVAMAIVVGVEARLAKADAVLLASIVAAQGALARCWLSARAKQSWGLVFVFWTALAVSIVIKGPVGVMVVGLTILTLVVFTRRARWLSSLRPIPGALYLLVLVLPWFVAIGIATDGGFYAEAIGRDMLGKVGQGQEGHGAPPGVHLAAMFGTFWPMAALMLPAAGAVIRDRRTAVVQFCLAWAVPSWIVFELVATKLPHYTMPLLPALAILTAYGVARAADMPPRRVLVWIAAALLALVPLGLLVASIAAPLYLGAAPSPAGVVLCAFAAPAGFFTARFLVRTRNLLGTVPRAGATALLIYVAVWGFVFPALSPIWISSRLTQAVAEVSQCADPEVMSVGFNEPSFVFLNGTDTRLAAPDAAVPWMQGAGCRILVIDAPYEAAFVERAARDGVSVTLAGRVAGVNINGGRTLDIGIYRKTEN